MKRTWFCTWLIAVAALRGEAASTTTWEMNNYRDFVRGRFNGVSLTREGRLTLAPRLEPLLASDQPVLWSVVQTPDGTIYAGSGHRGQVYRIDPSGKVSVFWAAEEPEVFALAVSPKGQLFAATSPRGKIFRFEGDKPVEFFNPQATYIWAMVFGKDGALFVGTGDRGLIYRVDPSGQGEIYYDTGQAHVTCLGLDAQGRLLAGTEPNGIIYRIEARDKAFVLYDAHLPEIRGIFADRKGVIYAAAQGGAAMRRALTPSPPPAGTTGTAQVTTSSVTVTVTSEEDMQAGLQVRPQSDSSRPSGVSPQVTTQFTPVSEFPGVERSALYRILPDHTVETLWSSREENIYDIAQLGDEIAFATDGRGRIYTLSADGKVALVAQTNESEVTRLLPTARGLLAATSAAGKLYRLGNAPDSKGTYESPVHDAGAVARWGRLSWIAETPAGTSLAFYVRSGNSMRPDRTWSEWTGPLTDPSGSLITAPNARYIQWKVEFSGTPSATPVLDSVTLAYLPQNSPPVVKNITVSLQATPAPAPAKTSSTQAVSSSYSITVTETGETVPPTSTGTPAQVPPRPMVRQLLVSWQSEDPDNDRLEFTLEFRGEGEREWKLVKDHLRESSYLIDADALADGRYFFRVKASDAPDNAPASSRTAELVSAPVLLDGTPPLVRITGVKRSASQAEIQVEAQDAASFLKRAEYSLDAGPWIPADVEDGVLDSPRERMLVRLGGLAPGEHLITVRVYDAAGNTGLAKVVLH